jgi:MFS family permease
LPGRPRRPFCSAEDRRWPPTRRPTQPPSPRAAPFAVDHHLNGVASPRPAPSRAAAEAANPPSLQSRVALNAANFFLAEVVGVVLPFLAKFLAGRGWGDFAVGVAVSVAGLGVFLMQTPAGFLTDRVRRRRALLAGASVLLGACYGLLPLVPPAWHWIEPLLFVGGAAQVFFTPLLGCLALALVGHEALNRTVGDNQGWNHAGNLASALLAMLLVGAFGAASVFYAVTAVSLLAAASVLLIRKDELDEGRACGGAGVGKAVGVRGLLGDRRILILFVATALFHLAKAPVMPLVGLYVARLGGSDVQVAAVVLVAQAVMIPVAYASGILCERWGRKPVFAVGFLALPVRIFLYSLTTNPWVLVALQALDGVGAGVYGVAVVAVCADLTRGKGGFNALQGLIATALSVGGVLGPLGTNYLAERLGFAVAFRVFAGVAAVAAAVFVFGMPETRPAAPARPGGSDR